MAIPVPPRTQLEDFDQQDIAAVWYQLLNGITVNPFPIPIGASKAFIGASNQVTDFTGGTPTVVTTGLTGSDTFFANQLKITVSGFITGSKGAFLLDCATNLGNFGQPVIAYSSNDASTTGNFNTTFTWDFPEGRELEIGSLAINPLIVNTTNQSGIDPDFCWVAIYATGYLVS